MRWNNLRIFVHLGMLCCQITDSICDVKTKAELSAFTAEQEEVQSIPATSEFCATTKVSFQNVNFDYTWRIVGLTRHMAYLKKFRNEFQIKYDSFKIMRDKFSGEWSISLTRDNLTLEYVTIGEYEAPTNFVCVLELVVGAQSKVYEFRKGVYYEEEENSLPTNQMGNGQEGSDAASNDNDGNNSEATTVVKKYSTISWPYFVVGTDTTEMDDVDKRGSSNLPASVQNILLDIEGTTTSIKFVTETLFPYARQNLSNYVDQNWTITEFQQTITLLRRQSEEDEANGLQGVQRVLDNNGPTEEIKASVIKNVMWQMDNDRKSTALKELQGKMWKGGFANGELRGHVFDDVPEAFKRWKGLGKNIYIYSSGSIQAQKLLFGHSVAGDLTKFLSGYFDTTTGPKREAKSYELIAAHIGSPPESIIFFTDIPAEAVAAKMAGMHVCLFDRPGNSPLTEEDKQTFQVENDFTGF